MKTLVLGGNGKTGSRVVRRLMYSGYTVRIGSRNAAIPFDWDEMRTWDAVLEGMEAVYITFQPDLAVPGAVEKIGKFSSKAVKAGVKKLVLLSGRGEEEAQACEQVVMNAGVDWTVVRASWFSQNFSESHMLEPLLAGFVALPAGPVGEPFIDVDDIAEVVVAALTADGHAGQVYEVTGPRLLSFEEAVGEIAAATGRPIHYEQVSLEAYSAMLATHGVPDPVISLIVYLFSEVLDGRNEVVMDGVERALGRKATDFSEYVRKTAATGVWNQVITN